MIHPDFFLASVDDDCFKLYLDTLEERTLRIFKHKQDVLGNRATFVPIKEPSNLPHSVPFGQAILRRDIRRERTLAVVSRSSASSSAPASKFSPPPRPAQEGARSIEQVLAGAAVASGGPGIAMGVDAEPIRTFEPTFLERNFSAAERADVAEHDAATGTERTAAGHWAVKEAVVKALGNAGAALGSADQSLCDVEVRRQDGGSLRVELHKAALAAAEKVGAREVRVSLTYAQGVAYAAAVLV